MLFSAKSEDLEKLSVGQKGIQMMGRTPVWLGILWAALAIAAAGQTTVTNSNNGSTNTIPVYTGTATLGNSPVSVSGGNVGIGTTAPTALLDISSYVSHGDLQSPQILNTYGGGDGSASIGLGANNSVNGVIRSLQNGVPGNNASNLLFITNNGTSLNEVARITPSGNVGIGTTSPGSKLEVNGNVKLTSGSGASVTYADGTTQTTAWTGVLCGGDYAEAMTADGEKKLYTPGDVLVLTQDGKSDVQKSSEPYSAMVAGIYATKPGVTGRREALGKTVEDLPMAMVGVVPTKVTTENGPIRRGDLLVTSSIPGYAMKGTDRSRMLGAVLGKAMGNLDSGVGTIEVLVTLQ